jgi:phage shock protein A
VLARFFEKSRDLWKAKYQALQERIKEFRTEVRDLRRSRDGWRAKTEALEQQIAELRAQIQQYVMQSPPAPSRRP